MELTITDEDAGQEPCPTTELITRLIAAADIIDRYPCEVVWLARDCRLAVSVITEQIHEIERLGLSNRIFSDDIKRRDVLCEVEYKKLITEREAAEARVRQLEADLPFIKAGHRPADYTCDHKHWTFEKHGRVCTCGTFMVDFGD